MYILRWALFIPAAFIASMFTGTAGTYIAERSYSWQWLIWVVSGSFSAGAFLLVGIKVVPRITGAVKWSLIGLLLGLGAASTIGSLMGDEPVRAFAGIVMMFVAGVCSMWSVPEIEELKKESHG
jgi:hypothetical protein